MEPLKVASAGLRRRWAPRSPGCCTTHADELARRVGAPVRARRRRRPPARAAPATLRRRPGAVHHRRRRRWSSERRRRRRGHRRHRAGSDADPATRWPAGASVVTANKALLAEDGPTLYDAADAARRRPLLRGRRGRRDPAAAAAARVARRRPGAPGARHRQRHHQLRARPDGHVPGSASPRRSRRPRRWATPRPTPPPTSRASTPPPRPRSSPRSPSTPGSPRPTSTARASPG